MLQRVLRTAGAAGVREPALLEQAFTRAMAPRKAKLGDDHDPRFLHPGRTALILMDDAGFTDARGLATAILAETESPELVWAAGPEDHDPPEIQAALIEARRLPSMADGEVLAERLVTAPEPIAFIALAEYLDQLRHLRLWADPERVRARGEVTAGVLLPVAERVHPVLARRYRWWVRRVVSAS